MLSINKFVNLSRIDGINIPKIILDNNYHSQWKKQFTLIRESTTKPISIPYN